MADYFLVMKQFISEGTAVLKQSQIEEASIDKIFVPLKGQYIDRTDFVVYGGLYESYQSVNDNEQTILNTFTFEEGIPIQIGVDATISFDVPPSAAVYVGDSVVLECTDGNIVYGQTLSVEDVNTGTIIRITCHYYSEKEIIESSSFSTLHVLSIPTFNELSKTFEIYLKEDYTMSIPIFLPTMSLNMFATKYIVIHTMKKCSVILIHPPNYTINGILKSKPFPILLLTDTEDDYTSSKIQITYNGTKNWFTI